MKVVAVRTSDTFENNVVIGYKFPNYAKEYCGFGYHKQFPFKYLVKNTLVTKILPKYSGHFWEKQA